MLSMQFGCVEELLKEKFDLFIVSFPTILNFKFNLYKKIRLLLTIFYNKTKFIIKKIN